MYYKYNEPEEFFDKDDMPEPQDSGDGKYEKEDRRVFKEVYEWIETCVMAVVAIILLFTFVVRTAAVSGDSMFPTLHDHDSLLISRTGYTSAVNDIVVVTREKQHKDPIIKRIIALEGQTVDIDFQSGQVFVDGEPKEETYVNEPTFTRYDVDFPVTVPEGCVFVMGDNRNDSLDSRDSSIGMVDERRIMGKAYFRMYPFESIGMVK